MDNSKGSIEFKIKSEELVIKDEVDEPVDKLLTTEENNDLSDDDSTKELMSEENKLTIKKENDSEGSVEFNTKSEELIINNEVDELAYELTTEETNDFFDEDDKTNKLMSENNIYTIKEEDDPEGSVEFQIKSEDLIIKDEVDEPAYELTTEETNDLFDDDDKTHKLMSEENIFTIKEEDDPEGSVEFQIKSEELIIKDEVDEPAYELTTEETNDFFDDDDKTNNLMSEKNIYNIKEEDDPEGSVEFQIKSEELIIKDEVDEPAYELTTEETNDLFDDDDKTNKLISEENIFTIKEEDDPEGSVEFQIKSEELIIKDEVDEPAYELATAEENNDWSDDQRHFVIIKSDIGPPHHIFDRFANIMIKVDSSICCIEDLNKILTCCVGLVNLPENVALSTLGINCEKQDANESSNLVNLDQAKQKSGTSEKRPYKCQECQKQFTQKSDLTRHMLIHEGKKPHKCLECQKQFTQKGSLKMHMMMHEGKRPYKCQECQKQFTQKGNLKMHILMHEGKRPYKCQECQKQFTQKGSLKMHMMMHEGKRPYICQECQKQFTQKGSLKMHMMMHEGKRPYKCQECQKQFTQKGSLKMHMMMHEGKRPYKCQECQKQFTQKGSLKTHMMMHEGKRPYKCQECQKQFTQKGSLKMHMMMHEGKRPYKCQECQKQFTQKGNLKMHMMMHERKRPYKCQWCQKQFTQKGNLTRHMLLIHEGKKPHTCQECQKQFIQKGNLKVHMLMHEGKKPHKCLQCQKPFTLKSNLTRHMLIHEGRRVKSARKCLVKSQSQKAHIDT